MDHTLPALPTGLLPRGSHSEVVQPTPPVFFSDTDLFAARLPRPSCPGPAPGVPALPPILNVTVGQNPARPGATRKPSFTIPLPLPSPVSPTGTGIAPILAGGIAGGGHRPSLAVVYGDENASRRSSYTRTPYPIDEAADYMSALSMDNRKMHPADKGEMEGLSGGIQWTDPWAASASVGAGASRAGVRAEEGRPLSGSTGGGVEERGNGGGGGNGNGSGEGKAKVKVNSVDIGQWASVGMEQAWSADSQSAVEGDSLLTEA
jgi:hypothetical protein